LFYDRWQQRGRRNALEHQKSTRPYHPTDLTDVVAMWRASKRAAFPYVEVQQLYTLQNDTDYFRNVVAQECDVWLATGEEQILGMLALRDDLIDQLFVAVDAQQQGIGSLLLEKARERSPDQLRAYTFQKNGPARAFFEKHGFEIVRSGISPPPENEPDLEYLWRPEAGD
jgi:ribosomal protein S18 acetylase RimI-like enzyme